MNDRPPEYLQGNIDGWQKKAAEYAKYAEDSWSSDHPSWGTLDILESDIGLLPEDMSGMTCID